MNAWIGHYAGRPSAWFLVVASTRAKAEHCLRGASGEPDRASMRPVHDAFFEFTARLEPEIGGGLFVDCGMGPADGIIFGDLDSRRIQRILQPKFPGDLRRDLARDAEA